MLTRLAHAKVNLSLTITGRRPDGYHTLDSVMHTIALADELAFEPAPELTLACDDPSLPTGADNLVIRAGQALRAHAGRPELGARITLRKRIPAQAGLGGGSADAAAALLGLSELWGLGLSARDLLPVAARLGSDVGFFLFGGAARVSGVGDVVEPLPPAPRPLYLVIAKPAVGCSTAEVYRRYDEVAGCPGPLSPGERGEVRGPSGTAAALAAGDLPALAAALHNDLEQAVLPFEPAIADLRRALLGAGALAALLCGSGSAVFGLCRDEEHAGRVLAGGGEAAWRVQTTTSP